MTRDDIIRMAREAAARRGHTFKEQPNDAVLETMAEAYAMGAAAERKRFSSECIDLVAAYGGPVDLEAAIRARGQA